MDRPLIISANPFIGHYQVNIIRTFVIKKRGTLSTYGYVPDLDMPSEDDISNFYDIEQKQRTSLFKDKEFKDKICLLAKPTTCKLFLFIAYYLLQPDHDYVNLKPDVIQKALDISRNSLYLAISELKTFRLLANGTKRNIYYINPEYMFNGKRITYLKERRPDKLNIVDTRVKYI